MTLLKFVKTVAGAASVTNMKEFASSDLYLCSYLKAKGLKLHDYQRQGRKVVFIFQDTPDRPNFEKEFFNGGMVEIRSFLHALKDLRAIIYDLK